MAAIQGVGSYASSSNIYGQIASGKRINSAGNQ